MDFYRRVELAVSRIPYGKVATYGQIALLCGKPKNARQVGYALNRRMKEEVPAHRVVNAKGYLSGAAAFLMPGQQELMLRAEGVWVDGDHCIDLKKFGWHSTMEDVNALLRQFEEQAFLEEGNGGA